MREKLKILRLSVASQASGLWLFSEPFCLERGYFQVSHSHQGTSQRYEDLSLVPTSSCIPLLLLETWKITHKILEDTQHSNIYVFFFGSTSIY